MPFGEQKFTEPIQVFYVSKYMVANHVAVMAMLLFSASVAIPCVNYGDFEHWVPIIEPRVLDLFVPHIVRTAIYDYH